MRALSSIASLTVHAAVGAALLIGTADAARSRPAHPSEVVVLFPRSANPRHASATGSIGVRVPNPPDLSWISVPVTALPNETPGTSQYPIFSTSIVTPGGGEGDTWAAAIGQAGPEVLTGPVPMYPELLRQAGIQGRVLLEAVVDSAGRVSRDSILVVFATNPAFVTAARQALVATLFRPAFVGGRPMRMRVRVPYEFTIRSATPPAP